jgi:CheY-like chemotaxis protein
VIMATILLVEDDHSLRKMLCIVLKRMGHQVIEGSNGKEAVQIYHAHQVDLILMDLIMPEKEGIETIVELGKCRPVPKIIAMSGGNRMQPGGLLSMAQQLGACATLTKPFSNAQLEALVSRCLEGGDGA